MAATVARLEPYGITILLGVLIVLPLLRAQSGVDLNIISRVIRVRLSTAAHFDWVLPKAMAATVARLEPYGITILLGVLIVLPLLRAQSGVDLNIISRVIRVLTGAILDAILRLTGNVYVLRSA